MARVQKGLCGVLLWEGARDRTELKYFDPKLMAVTLCLSCSSDTQPEPWVLAFFTASYKHLLWTPIHQGPKPLRPGVAFPTTSRLHWNSNSTGCRTQFSYIIIRCPFDLWNRMFNCHQAEITVMQFRGHSLRVHQSMSVPWEFFSSSCFVSQFPPTRFPLLTAIGMCHFLPVHHLEWHFARAEGQNITFYTHLSC